MRVIFLLRKSDISPIGEVISAYGGLRIITSLLWGILTLTSFAQDDGK